MGDPTVTPTVPTLNATAAADAGWVPTTVPIAYEGRTGTGACVPSGLSSCRGTPMSVSGENTWFTVEHAGVPQNISLTVTWDAPSPATEKLRVRLLATKSCGDGCIEGRAVGEPAVGPSPLTLNAPALDLGQGESVGIVVGNARVVPNPPILFFGYSLEQAFKVEGELLVLAPPA